MTHHTSKQTNTLFTRRPLLAALTSTFTSALAVALALTLSACGGGGADTTPVSPTPTAPSTSTSTLLQGRWLSSGLTPTYTAIMVPATTGATTPAVDTVWALPQDASTLIKLKASGSAQTAGAVTGNVYRLGTTSVSAVTEASYTLQSVGSANTQQMSLQPVLGTTALFDRTDTMASPLRAEQANGRWVAALDTVAVNWTVQGTSISGTSTSGCTYSGQSTVVTTQSLYKVQFTETCAGTTPATQTFHGVATISPDDTRLTVVATNEAETRAAVLLLTRQP